MKRNKSKRNPPLSDSFLDVQERRLLAERDDQLNAGIRAKEDIETMIQTRENEESVSDDGFGEASGLSVTLGVDQATVARSKETVELIDNALRSIQNGTYGICTISGKPIPQSRLKALPWANSRVDEKAGGY